MSEALWFNTPVEYAEALGKLLDHATRSIRIYDWDLSDGSYEQPGRIEILNNFCRQGTGRQVRILLADETYLTQNAGQMMHLLTVWGHVLEIRVRDSEPPPAQDCFVLVDDKGVLKRFDKDTTKGVMRLDERGDVVDLGIRFDSEWERAPGRITPRTLGL
jgi:hypothetical protein